MDWLKRLIEWFKGEPKIEFTKPARKVSRIFIHCSASDNPHHDDVEVIRKWHLGKGWKDIGYHYYINKQGVIQNGRALSQIPAAQAGHNTGTIAICLGGENIFSTQQLETLKRLCIAIDEAYEGEITFHGHREVSNKRCPVIDYKAVLKLDAQGVLGL